MSNIKELRKKAKELGINSFQKSVKQLQDEIEAKTEGKSNIEEKKPKEKKSYNTAVILNGRHEVRRYTEKMHGEDFEALANEFVKGRGYRIELREVKKGIICPSCGHVIDSKV